MVIVEPWPRKGIGPCSRIGGYLQEMRGFAEEWTGLPLAVHGCASCGRPSGPSAHWRPLWRGAAGHQPLRAGTERSDAVPGYVELSDGSIHRGRIYLTRGKRLQVYDEKRSGSGKCRWRRSSRSSASKEGVDGKGVAVQRGRQRREDVHRPQPIRPASTTTRSRSPTDGPSPARCRHRLCPAAGVASQRRRTPAAANDSSSTSATRARSARS